MKNKIILIITSFLLLSGMSGCPNRSSDSSIRPSPNKRTNTNSNVRPINRETITYHIVWSSSSDYKVFRSIPREGEDTDSIYTVRDNGRIGDCKINPNSRGNPLTSSSGCHVLKGAQKEKRMPRALGREFLYL